MRRNIVVVKKALSADVCNKLIQIGNVDFQNAKIGHGELDPDVRQSQICWLDKPMLYLDVIHPVQQLIVDINNKFYGFSICSHENFQVTKYDGKYKGKYDPHYDAIYDNASPDTIVRKLSVSIQLTSSEYYEGGNLVFPDDRHNFNEDDAKEQGTAIFFPSYLKHGVEPVTQGIRYSLVCWSKGPNFI